MLEDMQRALRGETLAGVHITPSTAMQVVAVYACVRILAESLAQIPIKVYRRRPDGRGKDDASDHPLYALLHDSGSPNDWQTSYEWKEGLQGHAALRGNGYSYISRSGNKILELLPLNPDRIRPQQDENFNVTYLYIEPKGGQTVLKANEVFHIRGLGTDGVIGYNPIQLQREALGLSKAAEKHGSKFLGNFAQPAGVLSMQETQAPEKMKQIREAYKEAVSGDNAFKTLIVDGGMTWSKMTMTNEEAQFLETRKFQTQEIARMWRVPPHMIGDLERATFSNIEEQSLEFVIYTMMPWLKRWENRINKSLFTQADRDKGFFAEFNLDALLRGDFETRVAGYGQLINWGIMSPNEARAKENMNPREGGDIYLTPVNMTSFPDKTTKAVK